MIFHFICVYSWHRFLPHVVYYSFTRRKRKSTHGLKLHTICNRNLNQLLACILFCYIRFFQVQKQRIFIFKAQARAKKKITESKEKKEIERRKEKNNLIKIVTKTSWCDINQDFISIWISQLQLAVKLQHLLRIYCRFPFFSISFTQPLTSRSRFGKVFFSFPHFAVPFTSFLFGS